jgi:hypothetical protein
MEAKDGSVDAVFEGSVEEERKDARLLELNAEEDRSRISTPLSAWYEARSKEPPKAAIVSF